MIEPKSGGVGILLSAARMTNQKVAILPVGLTQDLVSRGDTDQPEDQYHILTGTPIYSDQLPDDQLDTKEGRQHVVNYIMHHVAQLLPPSKRGFFKLTTV